MIAGPHVHKTLRE